MTPKQKLVLDTIRDFQRRRGFTPSYEEIAAAIGVSSQSTIHKHIVALEMNGYLHRKSNTSRSLQLVDQRGIVTVSRELLKQCLLLIERSDEPEKEFLVPQLEQLVNGKESR